MYSSNMDNSSDSKPKRAGIDRRTLTFILLTQFLGFAGIGLIGPVLPFILADLVAPADLAQVNGLVFTSFSFFQFLAVPGLGALSDRYGRRPVLLFCLIGSAVGYLLLGIGGALWILFLGRIIDGITGGNIGVLFAVVADVTEPAQRSRYYGLLGAVGGLGFVVGPAVGTLLSRAGLSAPVYAAAAVYVFNTLYGLAYMPETLPPEKRKNEIYIGDLNPFAALFNVLRIPQIFLLLVAIFLFSLPFAALQTNLSVYGKDVLGATPDSVGIVFTIIGVIGVVVQGFLIRRLQPIFGDVRLAITGLLIIAVAFGILVLIGVTRQSWPLYIGAAVFAFGNSLATPSLTGLVSNAVSPREQGLVQGGNQGVQALARIVGPYASGLLYTQIAYTAPYATGVGLALIAALCVYVAIPAINRAKAAQQQRL